MNRFRWIAATALALASFPTEASPTGQFSTARMSEVDKILASDAFEGRGTAAPVEPKVIDYIAKQFAAAGIEPGGDILNGRRSWYQSVPLLESQIVGTPEISINENGTIVKLQQGPQIAVLAPLNGAKLVDLENAPMVFAGYGVEAPERGWNDFKGQDMHGKVLVVLVNDPDFEAAPNEPVSGKFGGKAMTYYGRWTYKYEEAARLGAAGIIIVHETAPASYGWDVVQNSNTNAQFDIVRDKPAAAHTPFESWIQRQLAVELFARSGLDFEQEKVAARSPNFRPVPLKATLTAHIAASTQVISSHNVVGILPGKKYPGDTVIFSAHWDHLGIGKPDSTGDRVYHGAVDNGTGIAELIEQARVFAQEPRPDRSIVFLAVTGEEKGLLGSGYYAAHPLYPLATTVADLNVDAWIPDGPQKNFTIRGTAKLDLADDIVAEGRRESRYFTPDPHPETGGFYRSDHFSFAKVGVPAVSFSEGLDLVKGGISRGEAIADEYNSRHYHQPSDVWHPDWDWSGIAQNAELLHRVGLRLANSREWPNWSADSEFRSARDQSTAARSAAVSASTRKKGERG